MHCKSTKERGVADARSFCSDRYLTSVLALSPAQVVVFLGDHAERAAHYVLGLPPTLGWRPECEHVAEAVIAGRNRVVAFLPHPNYRGRRTPMTCWLPGELEQVRARLREPG